MSSLDLNLSQTTLVAFDTETTGAYPLGFEVVEFGAVKWRDGKIIDELEVLVKPSVPMSAFVIGIHGITNEMVENKPPLKDEIQRIRNFFDGAIPVAHHAPFDMGFMAMHFEEASLPFPTEPVLCSSLLARNLIHESPNHKLQTLIKVLNLQQGTAHRALDDAKACLEVALECWRRLGVEKTLLQVEVAQGKQLRWTNYSLLKNENPLIRSLAEAIRSKKDFEIVYEGGSQKDKPRRITPIGIVRNPDGDFVMSICHNDRAQKRFYLSKIRDFGIVY